MQTLKITDTEVKILKNALLLYRYALMVSSREGELAEETEDLYERIVGTPYDRED